MADAKDEDAADLSSGWNFVQDFPRITSPKVFLYDVDKGETREVNLPENVMAGNLQWRPNSNDDVFVGVAWNTRPFRPTFPRAAHRESRLFRYDLEKGGKFAYLTSKRRHSESPRFSLSGSKLAFLENCLESSTRPKMSPSGHDISRRLKVMHWDSQKFDTIIENSQRQGITRTVFGPLLFLNVPFLVLLGLISLNIRGNFI